MTLPFDPRFRRTPSDMTNVAGSGPRQQGLLGVGQDFARGVGQLGVSVARAGAAGAKALYHEPRKTLREVMPEVTGYASAARVAQGQGDLLDKVGTAASLVPGLGLLAGGLKEATAAERFAAKVMGMADDIEKAGGASLTKAGEHFAAGKHYSVGMGTAVKPTKTLTAKALIQAYDDTPDGHNVGLWKDPDTKKWFIEKSRPYTNHDDAMQAAVNRGEKAIWDHAAGENINLVRHHSPTAGITELDPAYFGKGPLKGRERSRAGAVPGVHFYLGGSPAERELADLPAYFAGIPESKLVNLGRPRSEWPPHVQELLKGMKDANDMERRLQKAGIAFENTIPEVLSRTDIPRIGKSFSKHKVWQKGGVEAPWMPEGMTPAGPVTPHPLAAKVLEEAPFRPTRPPPDESLLFPDTPAADARAGLLGNPLPTNSVHQVAPSSLLRNRASTAPAKAREAGLERAAGKALQTDKFDQSIQLGKELGADRWYDTDRLAQQWIDALGPEEGPKAFRQFAQAMGATSPGAQVPANIRRASHEYGLMRQGQMESSLGQAHRDLPLGYSATYQGTNNSVLRGLLKHGEVNTPKASSFVENLAGNPQPATIDRHFVRAFNETLPPTSKFKVKGEAPSGLEYGSMERAFQAEAERRGMTPAELQASWWVGMGNETGMLSGSASFEDHVAHRVIETAKALGKDTPEGHKEVMKLFIQGRIPLLGIGGVAAGAALAPKKQEGLLR